MRTVEQKQLVDEGPVEDSRIIEKNLVKKCLEMFAEISEKKMTTRSSTSKWR